MMHLTSHHFPKAARLIVATLAAAVLAACGSAPKLATPTGADRVPVNSDAALTEFQSEAARVDRDAQRRTELEAQIRALRKQVAELRAYLLMKAAESERNAPKGLPADRPPAGAKGAARPGVAARAHVAERIDVAHDGSMVFRTTFAVRAASFAPREPVAGALAAASRLSTSIEVRTTDEAPRPARAGRPRMPDRAQQAIDFLVAHGVPRERIQVVRLPQTRPSSGAGTPRAARSLQHVDLALSGIAWPEEASVNEAARGL